jgi:glutathione synthase/RimK-type ligase-like ATP-grasp enzyme
MPGRLRWAARIKRCESAGGKMNFLITTIPGDVHAAVVSCELRSRGHHVSMMYGEDYPSQQGASIRVKKTDGHGDAVDRDNRIELGHFDVVWNRRRIAFSLPDTTHPDDRKFAINELRAFTNSLWNQISPAAFWVNPLLEAIRANQKPYQLATAKLCGFDIPETLFSNDPDEIRHFLKQYGKVVYKSFMPAFWDTENSFKSLLATLIDDRAIADDMAVKACPGIYQQYIKPACEVRVTVFGVNMYALKHTISSASRSVDSRAGHLDGFVSETYDIPDDLRQKILELMARMNIRFGCLDILVQENGRYVFLEINEAGQFLWLEELQPSIPMLASFCSYLERSSDRYAHSNTDASTSMAKWRDHSDVEGILAREHPLGNATFPSLHLTM